MPAHNGNVAGGSDYFAACESVTGCKELVASGNNSRRLEAAVVNRIGASRGIDQQPRHRGHKTKMMVGSFALRVLPFAVHLFRFERGMQTSPTSVRVASSFSPSRRIIAKAPERSTRLGQKFGAAAFDEIASFGDNRFEDIHKLPWAGLLINEFGRRLKQIRIRLESAGSPQGPCRWFLFHRASCHTHDSALVRLRKQVSNSRERRFRGGGLQVQPVGGSRA